GTESGHLGFDDFRDRAALVATLLQLLTEQAHRSVPRHPPRVRTCASEVTPQSGAGTSFPGGNRRKLAQRELKWRSGMSEPRTLTGGFGVGRGPTGRELGGGGCDKPRLSTRNSRALSSRSTWAARNGSSNCAMSVRLSTPAIRLRSSVTIKRIFFVCIIS